MSIKQPYLIQRGRIESPLAEPTSRLSRAVEFDYMGSAEFEFGAIPESFRRIETNADNFGIRVVNELKDASGRSLRIASAFNDEEFEEYLELIHKLRYPRAGERIQTKEAVRFEADYKPFSDFSTTDFWWDLNNDTMFTFNKNFANRLINYVASSLKYMNDRKTKA